MAGFTLTSGGSCSDGWHPLPGKVATLALNGGGCCSSRWRPDLRSVVGFDRNGGALRRPRRSGSSLAEGATIAKILADFPTLADEDVRAAIAFAAASAQEDLPLTEISVKR